MPVEAQMQRLCELPNGQPLYFADETFTDPGFYTWDRERKENVKLEIVPVGTAGERCTKHGTADCEDCYVEALAPTKDKGEPETDDFYLCFNCGEITHRDRWTYWQEDLDGEHGPEGALIPNPPGESDPLMRCPQCGELHGDCYRGAGIEDGTKAECEVERASMRKDEGTAEMWAAALAAGEDKGEPCERCGGSGGIYDPEEEAMGAKFPDRIACPDCNGTRKKATTKKPDQPVGERAYLVRCGECGFLGAPDLGHCAKCGYDGVDPASDGGVWVQAGGDLIDALRDPERAVAEALSPAERKAYDDAQDSVLRARGFTPPPHPAEVPEQEGELAQSEWERLAEEGGIADG